MRSVRFAGVMGIISHARPHIFIYNSSHGFWGFKLRSSGSVTEPPYPLRHALPVSLSFTFANALSSCCHSHRLARDGDEAGGRTPSFLRGWPNPMDCLGSEKLIGMFCAHWMVLYLAQCRVLVAQFTAGAREVKLRRHCRLVLSAL